MKISLLIALTLLANFVNAQTQLSHYYDASVANRPEFSYNITVAFQKNEGATTDSKRYTATLTRATPDSKGYYNSQYDRKFYTVSQLDNIYNPNNFRRIGVTIFYNCNGQQKVTSISFSNLNEQQFVPVVLGAGGKFCESIDFNSIKVSNVELDPMIREQIRVKIEQKSATKSTQNSSTNSNPATQPKTTTGIPANTSTKTSIEQIPDNYKGNPMTYNTSSSNSDNTATQVLSSATNILNQWASQIKSDNEAEEARQNRIEDERVRKQNIADNLRANKFRLINNRKSLIAKFPDGKTPLSYEVKGTTEIFYFVYSYQPATIENNSPPIYISNVFSLVKYGDGTWPLKASLIENIAKTNKGLNLVLAGYYLNKNDAEQQQQLFISEANNFDFVVNKINYETKKSAQTTSGSLDYWGNPIKKEVHQSNIKTPATNEIEKPKIKVDYWGNIIREKTTN